MSIVKAKLYKTAVVAVKIEGHKEEAYEESEYNVGDIVGVEFIARTHPGQFNFRISAEYLGKFPRVVSSRYLKDFCL